MAAALMGALMLKQLARKETDFAHRDDLLEGARSVSLRFIFIL